MNVYQKLAQARQKLKESGLRQSGKNKGVGYSYFDLQDILPQTTRIENDIGLLSIVSFTETEGTLTVINTEEPQEQIVFQSPIRDAELRGCHPIQNLGAVETYVRRYLYLLAYEIVETDALDLDQDKLDKAIKTEVEIKGKIYTLGEMSEDQLDWIITHSQDETLKAARLVKQQRYSEALKSEQTELPFGNNKTENK